MTSVGPSPPKRIKLPGGPPPASKIPLLRPQSQSQSQSNNNNSSSTAAAAAAAKHPAPPQQVFSTAASSALRFRRIGSPRLSQSPVRKQPPPPAQPQPQQQQPATPSFFHDSDVGSSVARLGGTPADTPRAGTGTGTPTTSTPTPTSTSTPTPTPRRPVLAERAGNEKRPRDEDTPPLPPAKEKTPPHHHHHHQQDENAAEDSGEEALRRLLAERVAALRAEIEALKDQRELEEARIAREAAAAAAVKRGERDKDKDKDKDKERIDDGQLLQALVQRLLSANDGSHTTLPALPTVHTRKVGEEEQQQEEEQELIPSARPRTSTDPGAFHCLTFTRASTTTTTDPAAAAPLQQHTAAGYASARLLAFTLTFTLDAATARIHSLAATVSAWARAELRAPLSAAAADGDVSRALYALSSYTVMARRRAGVFARCARCFPDLLPGVVGGGGGGKGRREVVAWLGRSVVVFRRRGGEGGEMEREREREGRGGRAGVELVVGWRIGVDGLGEAESELSADVRFPGCWKDADDRGSLRKVGEVFSALVADRGVFEAVRCVAGLVFQ